MRRRELLGTSALLLFNARLAWAHGSPSQVAQRSPDLREELSAEEIEFVNTSAMAKDLDNYFGKGFS